MKFDSGFITDATIEFVNSLKSDFEAAEYGIDIPSLDMPPISETRKFISDPGNPDLQERIAKLMVVGKRVSITLDGSELFAFQLNSMNDSWDAIPGLRDHPNAYDVIINITNAFVLKKYSRPRRKNPDTVAAQVVPTI